MANFEPIYVAGGWNRLIDQTWVTCLLQRGQSTQTTWRLEEEREMEAKYTCLWAYCVEGSCCVLRSVWRKSRHVPCS